MDRYEAEIPAQDKTDSNNSAHISNGRLRTAIFTCLAVTTIGASIAASAAERDLDVIEVHASAIPVVYLQTVTRASNFDWHWGQGSLRFGETFLGSELFTPDLGGDTSSVLDPQNVCGNPVVFSRANKYESEIDFTSYSGEMSLFLERTYSEKDYLEPGLFGSKWRSNFDYKLFRRQWPEGYGGYIELLRPDRRSIVVDEVDENGHYLNGAGPVQPGVDYVVWHPTQSRYTYYAHDGSIEEYSSNDLIIERRSPEGIKWVFTYGGPANDKLIRVTHSSGRYVQFNWNAAWSEVVKVIDPAGTQYSYSYTPVPSGWIGKTLTSVIKPGGTVVSYQYDHSVFVGRLAGKAYNGVQYSIFSYWPGGQSTEHAGGVNKFSYSYTYDANGQVLSALETNPLGKQVKYQFVDGQRVSTTGYTSSYCSASFRNATYDGDGALDIVTDNLGNITDYDYGFVDFQKRLTRKIEAKGTPAQRTTLYTWDSKNRIVQETIVGLRRINYNYRPDNRIGTIVTTNLSASGVSGQQQTVAYGYAFHANGLPSAISINGPLDGTGDIVTSTYDTFGNRTSVQNSLGHSVLYSNYNALGQPGRITNENGGITDYTYDAEGRLVAEHRHGNGSVATTQYVFNSAGLLEKVISPDGVQWWYEYDAARRVTSKREQPVSGAGSKTVYTYDNASNLVREQVWKLDSVGNQIALSNQAFVDYDELSRVRARRGNNGQNIRYTYDVNGNVKTITDSLNQVTTLNYDALDRVLNSTDPLGAITRFEYDLGDRVTKVTDPRNLNTTYVYDGFGQLWAQYSPDTGTTSFQYSPAGLRTATTRADGSQLTYSYDSIGRLSWYGTATQGRSYTYDWCYHGKGLLCEANYAGGARHYAYTSRGDLYATRDFTAGLVSDDWTGYAFDVQGRLTGMSYPSGVSVGYAYSNDKLATMTATINGTTQVVVGSIGYSPQGSMENWTFGNGLQRLMQRDTDGRLTAIHTSDVQGLYFSYNANNEITNIQNGANANVTQAFAYDAGGRMVQTTWPTGGQNFTFDPTGNRTSHKWHPGWPNVAAEPYTIDSASNRVLNTHLNYTYDGRGNRATQSWGGSTATYTYDAFNHLKQVSRDVASSWMNPNYVSATYPAGTTNYVVNGLGQRVGKSGPLGSSRFVYAGQNTLLAEQTNGQWTSYLWLGGQPVGMVRNNILHWIHNDQVGRPEMVTNAAQQRVWSATNYAYDRAVNMDWIGGLNLGLLVHYYDADSGHWYNGFRDYDSRLGRYLQSDPIGLVGGVNTYQYAQSTPVDRTDPFGLDTFLVNRDLSVFGDSARSRDNIVTHTFIVITNTDGSINATYSWGNDANLRGWNENQPIDLKSAREALEKGLAERVGDSSLDPFVHKAYQKRQDGRKFFEHANGIVYNNCKTEANGLIDFARFLQRTWGDASRIW